MKKHDGWKKTVAFVLSLALVAGAMPANVGGFLTGSVGIVASAATEIIDSGSFDDVKWTLDSEGLLYIMGSGSIPEYAFCGNDWGNASKVKSIVFAEDCAISSIGNWAFVCYVQDSNMTYFEINSTVPISLSEEFIYCYYDNITNVDIIINAPEISNSINKPFNFSSAKANFVLNVKKPVVFSDGAFSEYVAEDDSIVAIPSGSYVYSPGHWHFDDENLQEQCDWDPDSFFWEMRNAPEMFEESYGINPSDLVEGQNYRYVNERSEVITTANKGLLFGEYGDGIIAITMNAKEPTCTVDGNTECYVGSNGAYYIIADNKIKSVAKDTVIIPATGHTYGEATWSWSDNPKVINSEQIYSKGTVNVSSIKVGDVIMAGTTIYCDKLNDVNGWNWFIYSADHPWDANNPTTCGLTGLSTNSSAPRSYTVPNNFTVLGINAHEILVAENTPTDKELVSASRKCNKCDKTENVFASVTSETIAPTYAADGKIVYTAKATFDGKEYTDTKEVAINKLTLPHYDAVAPTCTKDGTLEYWYDEVNNKYFSDANGENELTNIIDSATGHKWKYSSKTNNADGSLTVIFACENDGCNETYSVTFTPKQIEDISKIQGVTSKWEWAEDYSTATFTINPIPETMAALLATKLGIDQNIALYFAKNGITVPATVTTGETAPATCTQNGTKTLIAHVNQLTDTKIVDDNEQPATGHKYGSPIWSWSNNGNGYTATMKAVCSKCGEVKTYRANVTSTIADGMITYTATATVDGVDYTSTQQVKESYTLSVDGGTITDGAKESYSYADAVTVTAAEQQGGKFFSGWYIGNTRITTKQSYTFYIKSDMTVTAKYEGETVQKEQADVSVMINRSNIADDKQKVVFSLNWALPSGCKLKEAGIVRRYDNAEDLTLKNVDGSEIKKNASTLRTQNGNCNINLTVSATTKLKTINAVAYVVYTDKNGGEQTVYSNVQTSAYTN